MELTKKNKILFIDEEAANSLELVKHGLLYPITGLMGYKEYFHNLKTKMVNDKTFPFPFILAPSGNINRKILKSLKPNETITIITNEGIFATLIVKEVFKIDKKERVKQIYGSCNLSQPGVKATLSRLGSYAISGEYTLANNIPNKYINMIQKAKKRLNAKKITSIIINVNPLHRGHEHFIRQTLDKTDLLVIFLSKPYKDSDLSYETRKDILEYFVNNFLPKDKTIIIPLKNSYIFAGYNEIIIDAIVSKNYGCNRLVLGKNHKGLGMLYDSNVNKSIVDKIIGIDIEIEVTNEYVYCTQCTTFVSKESCPHGQHHQVSFRSESLLELLKFGILPPTILMRKEISALLLSKILPNRLKNLEKLYYDLLPVEGIMNKHTEEDFYLKLMKLYQTASLT